LVFLKFTEAGIILQLILNCNSALRTPVPVYYSSCSLGIMCQYPPLIIPPEWKSLLMYDGNTYQLSLLPNIRSGYQTSLVATFFNNYTEKCTLNINAYIRNITIFPLSKVRPSATSPNLKLPPKRYHHFQAMIPGTNSILTNETLKVKLFPNPGNKNSLFTLFYAPFPYDDSQNMISATFSISQENATSLLTTQFQGYSPYQPFAIYNSGDEEGQFVIEITKPGYSPLPWILLGCGAALVVVVVVAVVMYLRSRKHGYEQINTGKDQN